MAKILRKNKRFCTVVFNMPSLKNHQITAVTTEYRDRVFVNFALPTITFRHDDARTLFDITDGMKKIAKYAAEATGKNTRFRANPEPLCEVTPMRIKMKIFPKRDEPYIDARVEDDGFVRWTILGHYFNNDPASAAKYIACIEAMAGYSRTLGMDQQ